MDHVVVMDHPLIKHKLTHVRKEGTDPWLFRQFISEITYLMVYESTRDLRTRDHEVHTPLADCESPVLDEEIVVVPILRAGLGMLDGVLRLAPMARVGFVGLYRDHDTLEPVEYYCKTPPLEEAQVMVLDPMLATGGSTSAALSLLKDRGASRIRFLCILASPEGVRRLRTDHSDVEIYAANVDEKLNDQGYILPGIGDCGDRLYGTK